MGEINKYMEKAETSSKNQLELQSKLVRAEEDLKSEKKKLENLEEIKETLSCEIKILKSKLSGDGADASLNLELHDRLAKAIEDLGDEMKKITEEKSNLVVIQTKQINALEENLMEKDKIQEQNKQLIIELENVKIENKQKEDGLAEKILDITKLTSQLLAKEQKVET